MANELDNCEQNANDTAGIKNNSNDSTNNPSIWTRNDNDWNKVTQEQKGKSQADTQCLVDNKILPGLSFDNNVKFAAKAGKGDQGSDVIKYSNDAAADNSEAKASAPKSSAELVKKYPQLEPSQEERKEHASLKGNALLLDADSRKRMRELDDKVGAYDNLKKIDNLPEAQRKQVLENVDKILDPKQQKMEWPNGQREKFAAGLINQIANPESIVQGNKNTCPAAVNEADMARTEPGRYAAQVAGLVTEGKLLGKNVLSPSSMQGNDGEPNRSDVSRLHQTAQVGYAVAQRGGVYVNGSASEVPPGPRAQERSGTGEWVWQNGKWEAFGGLNSAKELLKLKNDLFRGPDGKDKFEKAPVDPGTGNEFDRAEKIAGRLQDLGKKHGYPIQVIQGKEHTMLITRAEAGAGTPPLVEYQNTAKRAGSNQTIDPAQMAREWKVGEVIVRKK